MKQLPTIITSLSLLSVVMLSASSISAATEYICTTSGAYGQEETCVPVEEADKDRQVIREHDITEVQASLTRQQWILLAAVMLSGVAGAYSIKAQLSQ